MLFMDAGYHQAWHTPSADNTRSRCERGPKAGNWYTTTFLLLMRCKRGWWAPPLKSMPKSKRWYSCYGKKRY